MQDIVTRVSEAIRDKLSEIWDSVKRTIEEKWGPSKSGLIRSGRKLKMYLSLMK